MQLCRRIIPLAACALSVLVVSCRTTDPAAETESTAASALPPKVRYSEDHEQELKQIFALANEGRWGDAERRAGSLHAANPDDPTVTRVHNWVETQSQQSRDRAVEDRIREIDAKHSPFNPTIASLITEKKDRGLPPRQDVRDAVEQIESAPYIPESYGKAIIKKGPLFEIETPEGRMAQVLEKEVSVHLDNVTLETIIFNIGQAEGINFVADKAMPAFKQNLSIRMDKVKLSEFLNYVSRNFDVHFQVGADLVWIVDAKDTSRIQEETRFYRLRKGFVIPAQFGATEVTRVKVTAPNNVTTVTESEKIAKFVNDNAPTTPAIELAIQEFFHGSKFMVDYERNLIVARGTREQLETIERIIEEFDKPIQQVLIEARFITVSEAAFLQLGVSWETGRNLLAPGRTATDFTGFGFEVGLGLQETWGNILSRRNLSATLTALEQSGESHTLSAPRLTLINNLPGSISDGKVQYYYEEYTVKQQILVERSSSTLAPMGKPAKITSGVQLDVVASIGGDGKSILLALKPQVNQDVKIVTFASLNDRNVAGALVSSFDIKLPEYRTQELATRVIVRSGETVVMGGVLEREQTTLVESVPILGNLPLIGAAFRKRTEVDKPRYLLIFVTATILSDSGEFIFYEDI